MRYPGDGFQLRAIMQLPWYCPANEHPHWAAWAATVELAIRRIYAATIGALATWPTASQTLEPVQWSCPAVLLGTSNAAPRKCLTIELIALRNMLGETAMAPSLRLRRPVTWQVRNETIPWWKPSDRGKPEDTPSSEFLWNWAASPEGNLPPSFTIEHAKAALGGNDV
jgi:hypothetical protein